MKTLLYIIAFVLFADAVSAQRYTIHYQAYYAPETPFTGIFSEKRAITHETKRFDANGQLIQEEEGSCGGSTTHIHHSADGLADTLFSGGCVRILQVLTYSSDNRLKTWELFSLGRFTDFEYDEQGRIASITAGGSRFTPLEEDAEITRFDYVENTITVESIVDGVSSYTVTQIHYTDSGYIAEKEGGHTEYVFDEQDRLIRAGDNIFYHYTDSSYFKTEGEDRWEYVFKAEQGYLSAIYGYKHVGEEWILTGSSQLSYTFPSSPPSGNQALSDEGKIYGIEGALVVELSKKATVAVYSLSGALVKTQPVEGGESACIHLQRGIYVIRTAYGSYKAFVK